MKSYIHLLFSSILFSSISIAQSSSSNLMINTDVHIDSIGNATFNMSGKLTAQQWINWNYMYGGGNASNVKRTSERASSQFYLYDFKYLPNEMDRSFSIQYKAKGIVEYLGKDKWIANLGLRDAQPVKLTDNSFNCVVAQSTNTGILQNNMKVTLPASASNLEFDKDEFNYITVKYKMPTENLVTFGNFRMKTVGYSLLSIGILSLIGIFAFRKKLS